MELLSPTQGNISFDEYIIKFEEFSSLLIKIYPCLHYKIRTKTTNTYYYTMSSMKIEASLD